MATMVDYCEDDGGGGGGGESIRTAGMMDGIPWEVSKGIIIADVVGGLGVGGMIIENFIQGNALSWKKVAQGTPGYRVLVRYENPTIWQQVVAGGVKVARRAVMTGIWGAAINSAGAYIGGVV